MSQGFTPLQKTRHMLFAGDEPIDHSKGRRLYDAGPFVCEVRAIRLRPKEVLLSKACCSSYLNRTKEGNAGEGPTTLPLEARGKELLQPHPHLSGQLGPHAVATRPVGRRLNIDAVVSATSAHFNQVPGGDLLSACPTMSTKVPRRCTWDPPVYSKPALSSCFACSIRHLVSHYSHVQAARNKSSNHASACWCVCACCCCQPSADIRTLLRCADTQAD